MIAECQKVLKRAGYKRVNNYLFKHPNVYMNWKGNLVMIKSPENGVVSLRQKDMAAIPFTSPEELGTILNSVF